MKPIETIELGALENEIHLAANAAVASALDKFINGARSGISQDSEEMIGAATFLAGELASLDLLCIQIGKIIGHPFLIKVYGGPYKKDMVLGEGHDDWNEEENPTT